MNVCQRQWYGHLLTVTLLFVALAACSVLGDAQQGRMRDELKQSQQRWAAQHVANYRYSLQTRCFCPPEITQPVVIEVRNGVATSVIGTTVGGRVNTEHFSRYNTIEKLFAVIQDAIDKHAAVIAVNYDATFGYPTSINIDFDTRAIDDEISFTTDSFEVLK